MYGYARVSSKEQNLTGSSTRSPSSAWPTIWCSPTKRAGKTSSGRNTNGLFQRFAKTTWSWLLGSGGFSLDVTTARIQNAPFGHVTIASPAQSASFREVTGADCAFTRGRLRRMRLCVRWLRVCAGEERRSLRAVPHGKAQSAAPASRRMRFSVTSPPGRRGTKPPASLRGTMENGPTGQTRSGNPPPGCGGGAPGTRRPRSGAPPSCGGVAPGTRRPQPVAWPHGKAQSGQGASLRARPWARPGHHQAASCGLRRCRELRLNQLVD